MKLQKLFNPQSIAIVGASQEKGKVGNVITKNILELGYTGKIFLVNPKHEKIFDYRAFKSLADITEKVDLAIIVLPAKIVVPVIREASERVKNFVVISAGFSETNEDGKIREDELKKIADEKNLNILGPNCLGFIVPKLKLNASFAGGMPKIGNISFVSQSGALAVAIMDIARKENIKFSNIISVGNKMHLDESEILEYLASDNDTKVIGMYLEGIKNGQKFIEVAQKISKIKPIVILKAGKTEKAQKAISSHTGALAGSDEIISAVFEKTGVLRAQDLEEFFALLKLMSSVDAPKEKGMAIVTNAGGPGVLTTDAFSGKEIEIINLSNETKKRLYEFLPIESSVENPIDLLGDAMEDRYEKALQILEQEKKIGAILCVLTPQDQTPVEKIANKIIEFKKNTQKIVIAIFIGGERVEKEIAKLKENDIPNFAFPDQAVGALDKYYKWSIETMDKYQGGGAALLNADRKSMVQKIIAQAKKEERGALSFSEASAVAGFYDIKTPITHNIKTGEELPRIFEFPVVMKVDSDKVLHKTDKQGVILNIKNETELAQAYEQMKNNFPKEDIIIQPMLSIKTELIIGIKQDGVFGPIVVYGLGGIYTEIFKTVNFLVPPMSLAEIKKSLMQSKIKFLFEKTRGQEPYNLEEMAKILWGVVSLAQEINEIKELDINPLLIYNNGKEAVAVDVKLVI